MAEDNEQTTITSLQFITTFSPDLLEDVVAGRVTIVSTTDDEIDEYNRTMVY